MIPNLELIATHTAEKLVTNIKIAPNDWNIRSVTKWSGNTVLFTLVGGSWKLKLCLEITVKKFFSHEFIESNFVLTKQNRAFIGSRGSPIGKLGDNWWKGSTWLWNILLWSCQPTIIPTTESKVE